VSSLLTWSRRLAPSLEMQLVVTYFQSTFVRVWCKSFLAVVYVFRADFQIDDMDQLKPDHSACFAHFDRVVAAYKAGAVTLIVNYNLQSTVRWLV